MIYADAPPPISAPPASVSEIATASGTLTRYRAEFYADRLPYTALDMITRTPGFILEEGDDEVRGLSGAVGNILIDGERPTSKQEKLADILSRIPAGSVEAVEIIRGGAPGIAMQGKTVVANIVRLKGAEITTEVEAGSFFMSDGRALPTLRLQAARRDGERRIEGTIRGWRELDEQVGSGPRRRYDPTGALVRETDYPQTRDTIGAEARVIYQTPLIGGKLSLEGGLANKERSGSRRETRIFPDYSLTTQQDSEGKDLIEAGFNFDRGLGAGRTLRLVGLHRSFTEYKTEAQTTGAETRVANYQADGAESLVRASLQASLFQRWQVEAGGEAAFNFLDGATTLTVDEVGLPLPGAAARVEEARGEIFALATWRLSDQFTFEGGARYETSALSQPKGPAPDIDLAYFKPRAAAFWRFSARSELRVRIEREAGQLDFSNFIAQIMLGSGTISAGNPALRPSTAWVYETTWERRIGQDASTTLTLRREDVSDVVDRLALAGPIGVYDAWGNIGDGTIDTVTLVATLPLDRLGIGGGLLKLQLSYRDTRVIDPTTGEERAMSGDDGLEGKISYTHDLPARAMRYGFEYELQEVQNEFRFDDIRTNRLGAYLSAFAEYDFTPRWRLRVEGRNLTNRDVVRDRYAYTGPRGVSPLDFREIRYHLNDAYFGFSVRRRS